MGSGDLDAGAASSIPHARTTERTRPRYNAEDVATLLWRRLPLAVLVFLVVVALTVLFAMRLPTLFVANSSLLIRLGQEYVYDPRVGDAGRGAAPANDAIIQSEVEILNSAALKELVIRDIGLARLAPHAAAAASEEARRALENAVVKGMEQNLKVVTTPNTSVVRLTYSDRDPKFSALILNTLVDEYLVYRRQVLLVHDTGPLEEQRRLYEKQLGDLNQRYSRFLTENGIGDFDAEKTSLAALYGQLLTDGYSVDAQVSETQGRLGVTARLAAGTPREVGLYRDVDHTASDRVAALRLELQDLQARYRPGSQPVVDKEAQVGAMQQLAARGGADTTAARIGVNPVFQTAQTERNTLEAQLASLRSRRGADTSELARVLNRRQRLAALEPQYLELTRQRDLLTTAVRNFEAREQESRSANALSASGDSVRIIQRAYVPTRGTSLKRPVLALGVALAALTAACAALVSAFLSRSYPSERTVERTLDLPVLAVAPRKPRPA